MQNFSFQPMTITISAGDTVTWHNLDTATHTVTANDGSFDSGNVGGGGSFPHGFTQPGTYEYYCKIHGSPGSGMHGTVIVQGSGPPATQPPAPAPPPAQSPQPAPAAAPSPSPAAAPHTTSAPPTTAATTTTTSTTSTTIAPPAAADAGTTSSTTAAVGGGVALPAQKASSGSDDSVSPWLKALAVALVLGAGVGGVLLRRRLA